MDGRGICSLEYRVQSLEYCEKGFTHINHSVVIGYTAEGAVEDAGGAL